MATPAYVRYIEDWNRIVERFYSQPTEYMLLRNGRLSGKKAPIQGPLADYAIYPYVESGMNGYDPALYNIISDELSFDGATVRRTVVKETKPILEIASAKKLQLSEIWHADRSSPIEWPVGSGQFFGAADRNRLDVVGANANILNGKTVVGNWIAVDATVVPMTATDLKNLGDAFVQADIAKQDRLIAALNAVDAAVVANDAAAIIAVEY